MESAAADPHIHEHILKSQEIDAVLLDKLEIEPIASIPGNPALSVKVSAREGSWI
jgi:hypothetical protein